jgi:hypothetical protein
MLKWYLNTSFHKWWMDNVWKPAWDNVVNAVYGIPAGLVVVGETVSHWANDHTIADYLAQMNVPNWVPTTLAAIALVSYISRGRNA